MPANVSVGSGDEDPCLSTKVCSGWRSRPTPHVPATSEAGVALRTRLDGAQFPPDLRAAAAYLRAHLGREVEGRLRPPPGDAAGRRPGGQRERPLPLRLCSARPQTTNRSDSQALPTPISRALQSPEMCLPAGFGAVLCDSAAPKSCPADVPRVSGWPSCETDGVHMAE